MGLNLVFLTQTYPRREGDTTGPFIRDIARGLVRGGDRVTVIAPHAPDTRSAWDDDGVEVQTFRYAPERFEVLGYSRSLKNDEGTKLAALAVSPLYALAARAALRRHLAKRATDLIHAHWIVPNGLVAAPFSSRVAVAYGLHGSDVFLAEKPGVRRLVRSALSRGSLLTGCSPELVDRVAALGFDDSRCSVIPYGVDSTTFSPNPEAGREWRQKLGIPATAPMILTVGRMATKKGYQVLLEALPALLEAEPNVHMVFAGEGDRLEEFQNRAAAFETGSERVHFPGIVYRDTLPDLFRAADIFTLPAVHDKKGNVDGLPNVILEAMATGLPVVATAISGIPLAIREEKNGLLVDEGDGKALVGALQRLVGDPEARQRMGAEGRRRAVEELSWDAVAGRYRQGYHLALGLKGSQGASND